MRLNVPFYKNFILASLRLYCLKAVTLSPRNLFIHLAAELILRHLTDMSREVKYYSVQVNSIPVFGKSAGPLIYSTAVFITKDNCCTIAAL